MTIKKQLMYKYIYLVFYYNYKCQNFYSHFCWRCIRLRHWNFCIIMLYVTWNAQIVFYATLVIFVVIFGLIGLKIEIMVTIVATSFIGAFAAISGLSLLIGGFLDVTKIFDLIEQKEWDQLAEMTKSASLGLL